MQADERKTPFLFVVHWLQLHWILAHDAYRLSCKWNTNLVIINKKTDLHIKELKINIFRRTVSTSNPYSRCIALQV